MKKKYFFLNRGNINFRSRQEILPGSKNELFDPGCRCRLNSACRDAAIYARIYAPYIFILSGFKLET